MKNKLKNYINAGYGALSLTTAEYFRCMKDIQEVAQDMTGNLGSWDARGCVTNMLTGKVMTEGLYEPEEFFEWAQSVMEDQDEDQANLPSIWIVNDFHMFTKNPSPVMVATFRDAVRDGCRAHHHFILVGAVSKLTPEIENIVTSIEYELPTSVEIRGIIDNVAGGCEKVRALSDDEINLSVNACAGMTSTEASDAIALSVVATHGGLCSEIIMKEKAKAVEKSGALKYHETKLHRADVGGLEDLIEYVSLRKDSFSKKARDFGCPAPKGIILVGAAGTGKSLSAKVTADILQRPLISMDVGAVFGSLVGESEGNMRRALQVVEACAPCVLMID